METIKPRLLNLCCCAGGSCRGYELAGFDVWGVDIEPQPHYLNSNKFFLADALRFIRESPFISTVDAIHVSPPCQGYSNLNAYNDKEYPRLIEIFREELTVIGKPFVIENVEAAPLRNAVTMCGYMFPGLMVERHRKFEAHGFELRQPPHPEHVDRCVRNGYLPTSDKPRMSIHGGKHSRAWQRKACEVMEMPWVSIPMGCDAERTQQGIREICEAIPPRYTKYVGGEMVRSLIY